MTPGEIADATGRIWIRAFSDDPRLGPIAFAKMDHGMVWVTEAQAVAAADFGWRRSIGWPHDQLVAIERSEAEANAILAEPAKA